MTETPFFFPGNGYSLFGVFHGPSSGPARPPFVMCHAFGEEKLWTHRVFVTFARRLAAAGHPVLRFDCMGNGDSDGDFSASSLSTALADARSAIAEVRRRTGSAYVNLLGLRFGAIVAALVAEDELDVQQLILWSPISDGSRYMQELLRINLTTQMAVYKEIRKDRDALAAEMQGGGSVNVDGYEMTFPLFSEVSAVKLGVGRRRFAGRCLVVQVDRAASAPGIDVQQVASTYSDAKLVFAQEEPFWKEIARFYDTAPNLFDVTLEWLKDQVQPVAATAVTGGTK